MRNESRDSIVVSLDSHLNKRLTQLSKDRIIALDILLDKSVELLLDFMGEKGSFTNHVKLNNDATINKNKELINQNKKLLKKDKLDTQEDTHGIV
ncbi:hypothetical protein [Bacillus cihuensis]|uniref:hypothetical protein n=1 Tax=Bacillus cihuensis TaxID=1208599 RepID=UPI0003F91442|nr:hypothetical protein [Bacillus cihuensis]